MQIVSAAHGVWQLIDEAAPADANLIAVLRGPVEILAVKALCEAMLHPGGLPNEFAFTYNGRSYRATPYGDRGHRLSLRIDGDDGSLPRRSCDGRETVGLSLRIDGDDGSLSRVETEFAWPGGK